VKTNKLEINGLIDLILDDYMIRLFINYIFIYIFIFQFIGFKYIFAVKIADVIQSYSFEFK
jgi:hypothetical protein